MTVTTVCSNKYRLRIFLDEESAMAGHTSGQSSSRSKDPFSMYASPVGARFLRKANKIFEDFPVSKYILYFALFSIEVVIAFAVGVYLIR